MNPKLNRSGCSLIVLAEWKPPVYSDDGIRVVSASTRRNTPSCLDSKIHHNNLLNNILAAIEANVAGVDSAIMLDLNGFVSETNDTNLFIVRSDTVCTPHADACLPGLTRQMVLDICRDQGIPARGPRRPDPAVAGAASRSCLARWRGGSLLSQPDAK
jgi:branched-subunit amino acid aminotransferase/4-amino-4-deoxychorismate lyase